MDALPTELLLAIIDRLRWDQDSIATCNRLNRRWHTLTHHILYRQPRLDRLPALEAFVKTISPTYGRQILGELEPRFSMQPSQTQNQNEQYNPIADGTLRISQSTQQQAPPLVASSPAASLIHPGQLVQTINLSMLPHRWETVHVGHIQGLVEGCLSVSTLDLRDCILLRDNAVQAIAELLGPRNLLSLVLSGCTKITDVAVLSICAHSVRLENLELSGCDRLSDISILELGSAIIRDRRVSHSGFMETEPQLQGTSQTIRSLDLSHCTRITDTGIRGLRQGAVQLASLNLEGCYGVLVSDNDLEANEWEDLGDEDEDDLDVDSDLDVVSY
ncbi:MAG: hypothetical protein J3R72DRAFT_458315 [Linnemannia gamsii]|nr:MAG: hypothetical protein J3R72DRAFT_458315 [Linnemannia gamsii]